MEQWQRICISPTASITDAMATIDAGGIGLALVVDANRRLLGTVTDGDIRRGLLRAMDLQANVKTIMNTTPTVASIGESAAVIVALLARKKLQQMPIVDSQGCVVAVETLSSQLQAHHQKSSVVIMAGGFGTRMAPLTDHIPKPMLKVGSKPMLEILLEQLKTAGFRQFYFSLHHQADIIASYFKSGEAWDVDIQYLHESSPLGTAGALSLLPKGIDHPVLVMNADIMTQIHFNHLLQFHQQQNAMATLCVREYRQSIPYGVVELEKDKLKALTEKPSTQHFVNAGIYCLEPSVIDSIPSNRAIDMPDVLTQWVDDGKSVAVFPIREYWLDIGQKDHFEQAQTDYKEYFHAKTT